MIAIAYESVPEPLDYEALVADYTTGLVDRLRGFGPAADGLALWVPDEDPLVGLRNLWDAAACAGLGELAVRLGPTSLAQLDADSLLAMAARFGVATLRPCNGGMMVEVDALHPATSLPESTSIAMSFAPVGITRTETVERERLPACYREAVQRAAMSATHDVPVLEDDRWLWIEGYDDGVSLTLAVDPGSLRVVHAGFAGATDHVEFGVLEALCTIVEGLPVVEAADHGVIRLEDKLREGRAPVDGIVTPRAVAGAFDRPHALLRDALTELRALVPGLERTSSYDAGPAPGWRVLDRAERHAEVERVLGAFTLAHGLEPDSFALVAIEFDVRLVFRAAPHPRLAALTMTLERTIRGEIDARLEVYLEEIRDRNKLRRLAIVENDR